MELNLIGNILKTSLPAINVEKSGQEGKTIVHPDELNKMWILRKDCGGTAGRSNGEF